LATRKNSRIPRVGLGEVAKAAGVSARTVTNVVNGFEYVADGTRAKVQRAIEELGYRPNLAAKRLRTGRSEVITLAVPLVEAPYFAEVAREIFQAAARHSYTVLIEQTDSLAQRERHLFTGATSQFIDGLILSPVGLTEEELRELHPELPLVLLGERITGHIADHVAIDNVAAARVATNHLVEIGRRRIAAIGCHPLSHSGAALRYRGYQAALKEAGIAVRPELVTGKPGEDLTRQGGATSMAQLLANDPLPDAVLCYNDLMALGAIRMILTHGLKVPDDIAVVGMDDIEDGQFSVPSLTTIAPDKAQIASIAVDLLVSRISGDRTKPPQEIEAGFRLVVRESSSGR